MKSSTLLYCCLFSLMIAVSQAAFRIGDRIDKSGTPLRQTLLKAKNTLIHEEDSLKLYFLDKNNCVIPSPFQGVEIRYYDRNDRDGTGKGWFNSILIPSAKDDALVGECRAVEPYRYEVVRAWGSNTGEAARSR